MIKSIKQEYLLAPSKAPEGMEESLFVKIKEFYEDYVSEVKRTPYAEEILDVYFEFRKDEVQLELSMMDAQQLGQITAYHGTNDLVELAEKEVMQESRLVIDFFSSVLHKIYFGMGLSFIVSYDSQGDVEDADLATPYKHETILGAQVPVFRVNPFNGDVLTKGGDYYKQEAEYFERNNAAK